MSMSTSVIGFFPPNEEWKKMKAIYDAYEAASFAIPDEINKFFNWNPPSDAGTEIDLESHYPDAIHAYCDPKRSAEGVEVILENLPPNIKIIRFINSW